jgi:hypothetical protein
MTSSLLQLGLLWLWDLVSCTPRKRMTERVELTRVVMPPQKLRLTLWSTRRPAPQQQPLPSLLLALQWGKAVHLQPGQLRLHLLQEAKRVPRRLPHLVKQAGRARTPA